MVTKQDIKANGLTREQVDKLELEIREAFARRLYAAMIRKGLTQSETARLAGLGRHNITNYMTLRAKPNTAALGKLAKVLGVPPDELLPENAIAKAMEVGSPGKETFILTNMGNGRSRVVFDKVLRTTTAMKIGQMIAEEEEDGPKTSN